MSDEPITVPMPADGETPSLDLDDVDFFFDDELVEFDPHLPDDADDEGASASRERTRAGRSQQERRRDLPPEQRISELIESMNAQGKVLLRTIAFCEGPRTVEEVRAFIADQQQSAFSVFDGASITQMLARDGALERVDEDGVPMSSQPNEPERVTIDGMEFYRVTSPKPSYWRATAAGLAVVALDSPEGRLRAQMDKDADYDHVYRRILELCAEEGGSTPAALGEAVDDDPILEEPRRYAGYFIEKLERCAALEWSDGAWRTTELGLSYLRSE